MCQECDFQRKYMMPMPDEEFRVLILIIHRVWTEKKITFIMHLLERLRAALCSNGNDH